MRASLFLSAMFAVSLIGGAASAEKPDNRQKGDIVEKTYLKSATTPHLENRALRTMKTNPSKARDPRPSPGESRWNCGDDCSKHTAVPRTTSESTASRSQKTSKSPLKTNERAEQRWNCPSEGACSGVRSARTTNAPAAHRFNSPCSGACRALLSPRTTKTEETVG